MMRVVGLFLFLVCATISPAQISGQSVLGKEPAETRATLEGFETHGGMVNFYTGDVTRLSSDGQPAELKVKTRLKNGDLIETGSRARVEILLNPGYYLRLSENTQLLFLDLSQDNLKLKILKGSAIVEVLVNDTTLLTVGRTEEFKAAIYEPVTVSTPLVEYAITRGGAYRFDVRGDGHSEVRVAKGLAVVRGNKVKDGMRAVVGRGSVEVAQLAPSSEDEFDLWSRERARFLIEANKSLKHTDWYKQLRRNRLSRFEIFDDEASGAARERLTVSALGGLVSFAEEGAYYRRAEAGWEKLEEGFVLQYGDRVKTERDSRAEIPLYASCYLRLDGNSEIIYGNDSGKGVSAYLVSGSALISKVDEKERFPIALITPHARYLVAREGTYRLNVAPGGSELLVYEGQAETGGHKIKEGKRAVADAAGVRVVSFDKKSQDSFDVWNRKRVATLSSTDRSVRYWAWLLKGRRASFAGLWFFDKASNQHTFVPGLWRFRSPYGGEYSVRFRG